jgi:DNA-binding CsgD family transcriptional regulator
MGGTEPIGREAELGRIAEFVERAAEGSGALLIEGEAGAGKTTLWRAGLARASAGVEVLSCRPVQTEATLSFAGLSDLLGAVLDRVVDSLPSPQRRALDAALLLGDSGRTDHRALGAATLSTIRDLATGSPLIIAIDDIQWLDRASARALAFALRRLSTEPVRLVASIRHGPGERLPPPELIEALEQREVRRLRVRPFSVGATERLLSERLDLSLPRTLLLHLHETSRGNPLYALELGRALAEADRLPGPGEPLPVRRDLHDLLLERVRRLPADVRHALLLTSLMPLPTEATLARAAGPGWERTVERGRRAGIIEVADGTVRFAHPLLASAVAASASETQRRAAHALLAEAVTDEEEGARHLALAAVAPDEAVAAALERGSEHARGRGAPDAAAELAELARTLTPAGHPHDLCRRCTAAGEARFSAGDSSRAAQLFEDAAAVAEAGPERAAALWHLARVRFQHDQAMGSSALLHEALREAGDDLRLRAAIEHDLVFPTFASGDLTATLRQAQLTVDLAEEVGADAILSAALSHVAVCEFLLGHGFASDVLDRALALEDWDEPEPAAMRPSMIAAHVLLWCDRVDEARELLENGERELTERGDDGSLPWVWYRMAEADCWSGDLARGYERAIAADRLAVQAGQRAIRPTTCFAVALLAAHLGRTDEARRAAADGLEAATEADLPVGAGLNLAVLGFLELSLGHPDRAHERLGPLVAAIRATGFDEPGPLWWIIDEIEALVALGNEDAAIALTDWLEARARAIDRPGGQAMAARGRALIAGAAGQTDEALAACADSLRHLDRATLPFQRGRTLFTKGQIARRARKWGMAREALLEALATFEQIGAELWAARSREELARIGGRPATQSVLSQGERQIAELVAAGRTNREVAEALFVSPRTVSASLGRVYRKLGVSSRTEMASVLGRQSPPS